MVSERFLILHDLRADLLRHWSVKDFYLNSTHVDREVTVTRYEPHGEDVSQHIQSGNSVEVRGLAKSASEIQFSDLTRFEGDFDMGTYEQMLDYYHGMCNHLCVQKD